MSRQRIVPLLGFVVVMAMAAAAQAQVVVPSMSHVEDYLSLDSRPESEANAEAEDDPDLEALLMLPEPESPVAAQVAAAWREALGENFQRTEAAMLGAMLLRRESPGLPPAPQLVAKEKAAPKSDREENESAQAPEMSPLAAHVISGNWPVIKRLLASLPEDQRSPAYFTLLSVLADDAKGVVLPQDVTALIDASPGPIDDRQLAMLGSLLRRSLDQSEKPRELLSALKSGKLALTGDAAAKLLMAAGLLAEAGAFLPPLPEGRAEDDAPAISLHARHRFLLGQRQNNSRALAESWQLTLAVLQMREPDVLSRLAAVKRVLALAPRVPSELAVPWLRSVFRDESPLGLVLLGEIGQQAAAALSSGDPQTRQNSLRLLQLAGTQLPGESEDWLTAREVFTRGWINEAQKGIGGPLRKMTMNNDDKVQPLPLTVLLATAPNEAWRKSLAADTAEHVRHLIGLLAVRTGDEGAALTAVAELVTRSPGVARDVAEALLQSVAKTSDDDGQHDYRHPYGHHYWGGHYRQAQIVTRAGQLRNLSKLSEMIAATKALGTPPAREEALVAAFARCHSNAEVYLESDIVRVFGPVEELGAAAAHQLAQSLRSGLAGQWRDPEVQQRQGTHRTPQEQVAEILRGYALAQRIVNSAVQRSPDNVALRLLLAGVTFDAAEFLYSQQVDLATYVRQRDIAYSLFQAAHFAYAGKVESLEADEYDVEVYQQWFQAALGTSDLSYLTRQDEPQPTQVKQVATALHTLGPSAGQHLALFAESVAESLDQVPAPLKPYFVRNALIVAGDQPAARPLEKRLAYYDELLKEVELRLTVDGSDRVGHGLPFGVHVSLLGTRSVTRENDAFTALLIPSGPQSPDESDSRRRLEQELREKLSEAFTIESFAFHAPTTRPRSTAREGWQELPVAYAVLRAKDASVDRLPALQLDLEFADGSNAVRLPIRSQVVLLDCRDEAPRPARDVKIRQVLDDRQLADGIVRLEVSATAVGIVPELDHLLTSGAARIPGFEIKRVQAQELSLVSLVADAQVVPQTERRWLVELSPSPGAASTIPEFEFPAAGDGSYAVARQRYSDADIVDAEATTALRWPALAGTRRWLWPTAGVAVLAVLATLVTMLLRARASVNAEAANYEIPPQLTPFSVIGLLRRMQHDTKLSLSPTEREDLRESLEQLEQRFFVRDADINGIELEPLCQRWLARTRA